MRSVLTLLPNIPMGNRSIFFFSFSRKPVGIWVCFLLPSEPDPGLFRCPVASGGKEGDGLKVCVCFSNTWRSGPCHRQHKVYFRQKPPLLLYHKVGADVIGEQGNTGSLSKEMHLRRDLKEEVAGALHVRGYDEMFRLDPQMTGQHSEQSHQANHRISDLQVSSLKSPLAAREHFTASSYKS